MNVHSLVMPLDEARLFIQADKAMRNGYMPTAIAILENLIKQNPNNVPALINLGTMLEYAGKSDRVVGLFRRAVALEPDNTQAHYCLGLALLQNGVLWEGWQQYQWRMKRPEKRTLQDKYGCPMWNGQALAGKKVVIWTDQGIGDEILLGTMLTDLMRDKADYTLVCSSRMMPVFGRTFPKITIHNRDMVENSLSTVYQYDYQISVSELGKSLRPNEQCFDKKQYHYLDHNSGYSRLLRSKYLKDTPDNFLIGLSWNSAHPDYGNSKSIPFDQFRNILSHPKCTFINLQYGDAYKDALGHPKVLNDAIINPMYNMDAFVNQVAACDGVLSVSNTTVHVAGALGIPVLNILPTSRAPIWYWFRNRIDSPWYPSMKLIRRDTDGSPMPKVEKAFAEFLAN